MVARFYARGDLSDTKRKGWMMGVDGVRVVVAALAVFLANVAGHWFPWRAIPGVADDHGMLARVPAYVYGTASIFLGVALTVALAGGDMPGWRYVVWHGVMVLAAGAGTMTGYGVDALAEARAARLDLLEAYDPTDEG